MFYIKCILLLTVLFINSSQATATNYGALSKEEIVFYENSKKLAKEIIIDDNERSKAQLLDLVKKGGERSITDAYHSFLHLFANNNQWAIGYFNTLPLSKDKNENELFFHLLSNLVGAKDDNYVAQYFENLIKEESMTVFERGACAHVLINLWKEKKIEKFSKYFSALSQSDSYNQYFAASLFLMNLKNIEFKNFENMMLTLSDNIRCKQTLERTIHDTTVQHHEKVLLDLTNLYEESQSVTNGHYLTICLFKLISGDSSKGRGLFLDFLKKENSKTQNALLGLNGFFSNPANYNGWYEAKMKEFFHEKSPLPTRLSAEYFTLKLLQNDSTKVTFKEFKEKTSFYAHFMAYHQILESLLLKSKNPQHDLSLTYSVRVTGTKQLTLQENKLELIDLVEESMIEDLELVKKEPLTAHFLVKTIEAPFYLKAFNRHDAFSKKQVKFNISKFFKQNDQEAFSKMLEDLFHTENDTQRHFYWSELYPFLYQCYKDDKDSSSNFVSKVLKRHTEKDKKVCERSLFPIDLFLNSKGNFEDVDVKFSFTDSF
ncbi:MAG TPA: hypothetical protein VI959_05425 [Alphaproteobacteria bacterium]|nr:hypothetical protein [Alphaproteobacteria bacterium]